MKNKTIGETLLDLENVLDEMIDKHELQTGDILALVYGHLMSHRPDAFEEYVDDSGQPEYYYGPRKQ